MYPSSPAPAPCAGLQANPAPGPPSPSSLRPERASFFLKKGAKKPDAPDTNAFYYNTSKSKECQAIFVLIYKIFSAALSPGNGPICLSVADRKAIPPPVPASPVLELLKAEMKFASLFSRLRQLLLPLTFVSSFTL